jgi:hypothetical protein
MTGKVMNFLLNKQLLVTIATIISALFTFAIVMGASYSDGWGEVFWFVCFIGFIFFVAQYTPELVLHLKKIHLSNLKDTEAQELKETE